MHEKFPFSLNEKSVNKEQFYWWLNSGNIKREAENTVVAAHDKAVSTI